MTFLLPLTLKSLMCLACQTSVQYSVQRLEYTVGIKGNVLQQFELYLSDRFQFVHVTLLHTQTFVPRGSVLGHYTCFYQAIQRLHTFLFINSFSLLGYKVHKVHLEWLGKHPTPLKYFPIDKEDRQAYNWLVVQIFPETFPGSLSSVIFI